MFHLICTLTYMPIQYFSSINSQHWVAKLHMGGDKSGQFTLHGLILYASLEPRPSFRGGKVQPGTHCLRMCRNSQNPGNYTVSALNVKLSAILLLIKSWYFNFTTPMGIFLHRNSICLILLPQ